MVEVPSKFKKLRPGQGRAIQDFVDFPGPCLLQNVPTGVGKTLMYISGTLKRGGRSVILTSTKGLADQIMGDFPNMGIAEIRGKSNYRCSINHGLTAEDGMCNFGVDCSLKSWGCPYYDALRNARKANIIVTNYAFWLHNSIDTLGPFDNIVMDESHNAPQHLSDFLSVKIPVVEISKMLEQEIVYMGVNSEGLRNTYDILKVELTTETPIDKAKKLILYIRSIEDAWRLKSVEVVEEVDHSGILIDPIDITDFTDEYLIKGAKNIFMVSATIMPKTAHLLGLRPHCIEYRSPFPASNRRIYHIPTVSLKYGMPEEALGTWYLRIRQIIQQRMDRKGILHSVSYDRAKHIIDNIDISNVFISHSNAKSIVGMIHKFKRSKPPALLISPSVATGYDFPFSECEYQIIAKVPFPNMTSKIMQKRCELDPELPFYLAWQELVQASGRGCRAPGDRCETLIVDDSFLWLYNRFKHLCPKWFLEAVSFEKSIPTPPKRIGG